MLKVYAPLKYLEVFIMMNTNTTNTYTVVTTWVAGFPAQILYLDGEIKYINGREFKSHRYNGIVKRTVEFINTSEVKNTVTSLELIKALKNNARAYGRKRNK